MFAFAGYPTLQQLRSQLLPYHLLPRYGVCSHRWHPYTEPSDNATCLCLNPAGTSKMTCYRDLRGSCHRKAANLWVVGLCWLIKLINFKVFAWCMSLDLLSTDMKANIGYDGLYLRKVILRVWWSHWSLGTGIGFSPYALRLISLMQIMWVLATWMSIL